MLLHPSKTEIYFAIGQSILGTFLIAENSIGLCALFFGKTPEMLIQTTQKCFPKHTISCKTSEYTELLTIITAYIDIPGTKLSVPFAVSGTPFQQQVWKCLQDIPLGSTQSYVNIAEKIGRPKAIRAVANACASNKLAIIIPCHRVIQNNGRLSGYRWGKTVKEHLLKHEGINFQYDKIKKII